MTLPHDQQLVINTKNNIQCGKGSYDDNNGIFCKFQQTSQKSFPQNLANEKHIQFTLLPDGKIIIK